MPVRHILVDGYSVLHQWEELKAAKNKSLAAGRQVLIHLLTQFHDSHGGEMTIVFDGRSIPKGGEGVRTKIQIIYSKDGQTADAVIERMVAQSPTPSQYLVVTNDRAEQTVVEGFGAQTASTEIFHSMVQSELQDMEQVLETLELKSRHFIRKR